VPPREKRPGNLKIIKQVCGPAWPEPLALVRFAGLAGVLAVHDDFSRSGPVCWADEVTIQAKLVRKQEKLYLSK